MSSFCVGDDLSSTGSKIISHGSIYLAGNVMRRMVSFIMLPIYTRYLTPEHYGTLELLSMILDFAAILFGMRIGEAVFRFYHEAENRAAQNEVISTALWMVILMNAIAVMLLVATAAPISRAVFGNVGAASQLSLFAFTLVFQSIAETVLVYIRAQQRPWLFVIVSSVKLIVQLTLNIYFVVVREMAVDGVIIGSLISSVVITGPLLLYTFRRTGFAFSPVFGRQMFSFSYPLVLTSVISFYITFGDRYFIRAFGGGLHEVGVYSLGYKFGFLLAFLVGDPFLGIWNSERYNVVKQHNARERFQSVFLMFTAALVVVTVGVSIYVHDVLRVMSSPDFWAAHTIVPVIMLSYIFQSWSSFTNIGILIERKTGDIALGTLISAVLITGGYLYLIPRFGGMGAAIATAVAFGCRTIWITVRAERLYSLSLPWRRAAAMIGIGGAALALALLAPSNLLTSLITRTAILLAFLVVFVTLPGLLPQELRAGSYRVVRDGIRGITNPGAPAALGADTLTSPTPSRSTFST